MFMILPPHSYEEVREAVIDAMRGAPDNGVNRYDAVLQHVAGTFGNRHKQASDYPGADRRLHQHDADLVLEAVWDLFRQGVITLGLNSSNPGWP
jgi:hypothetical protein